MKNYWNTIPIVLLDGLSHAKRDMALHLQLQLQCQPPDRGVVQACQACQCQIGRSEMPKTDKRLGERGGSRRIHLS